MRLIWNREKGRKWVRIIYHAEKRIITTRSYLYLDSLLKNSSRSLSSPHPNTFTSNTRFIPIIRWKPPSFFWWWWKCQEWVESSRLEVSYPFISSIATKLFYQKENSFFLFAVQRPITLFRLIFSLLQLLSFLTLFTLTFPSWILR